MHSQGNVSQLYMMESMHVLFDHSQSIDGVVALYRDPMSVLINHDFVSLRHRYALRMSTPCLFIECKDLRASTMIHLLLSNLTQS